MEDLYDLLKPQVEAAQSSSQDAGGDEEDIETFFQKYHEGDEKGFGDEEAPAEDPEKPIRVAITGRPNVGKSTLLNALLGQERAMTGPEAGLTRDAIHADWQFEGRALQLVDTAGLRRKAKIFETID